MTSCRLAEARLTGTEAPIPGVYPIPGSDLVAAILGHVTGEWHASYVTESGTVRHHLTRTQSGSLKLDAESASSKDAALSVLM